MTTFITFKQFDIIYLLTQQRGYMTGATLNTVITYVHQNAFVSNNYGLSSAVSMLLFVIIIIFSAGHQPKPEGGLSMKRKTKERIGYIALIWPSYSCAWSR